MKSITHQIADSYMDEIFEAGGLEFDMTETELKTCLRNLADEVEANVIKQINQMLQLKGQVNAPSDNQDDQQHPI